LLPSSSRKWGGSTPLPVNFIEQDIIDAFDHLTAPPLFASWTCWISESRVEYIMRAGQLSHDIAYFDFNKQNNSVIRTAKMTSVFILIFSK